MSSRRSEGIDAGVGSEARASERIEVGLEHMRWRHFGWALAGLIGGGFLVWRLGAVGKGIGAILLLMGAWATWSFVRTLLFPAGAIVVEGKRVSLPRGLCRGAPVETTIDRVRHAYFLRRAVPWTRAAPVLVIETDLRAYLYPRDWFVSEAEQRRVVSKLVELLRRDGSSPATAAAHAHAQE